ncbi:MAG: Rv2175c family DNA-binding protein [Mycobacteriales bacterium]
MPGAPIEALAENRGTEVKRRAQTLALLTPRWPGTHPGGGVRRSSISARPDAATVNGLKSQKMVASAGRFSIALPARMVTLR